VDRSSEAMLVIKSQKKHFLRIVKEVKALHSYSVPEVIALPIAAGLPEYLKWIKEST
jgi:periplasmic divalent cation tolerance protein